MKYTYLIILFSFFSIVLTAQNETENLPKIGLALSGGGAKGYAHIGVLKALEEENIRIDFIGGTSMGAIIGSLFSAGYTSKELENILQEIDFNDLLLNDKRREDLPYFDKTYREKYILELPFDKDFKLQLPHAVSKGQGPANVYSYLLRNLHDVEDFSDLPIPFLCVATELSTGKGKVLKTGYLPQAILASGAFPTLINPVEIDGKLYTDGGIVNNFPAKQVKEMGSDIVIGVDLGDKLLVDSALVSAPKVLEQIIRYQVVDNMERQRRFVDVLIEPEVDDFSVVDFDNKDSIILAGYTKAKDVLANLKDKKLYQKTNPHRIKINRDDDDFYINDIVINGLENFNRSFIKGKLKLDTPQEYSYEQLEKGIKALYSTGYFENVFYRLKTDEFGGKLLILNIKERENNYSAKFAIRYDDVYKTSLLLNLSARHFIFKNSALSADLILGDNIRYNFNFFIDNGVYPSFGFESRFNQFETELDLESENLSEIDYEWNEMVNRFYVQSTVAERYAIGFGAEHQLVDIHTDNLLIANPLQTLDESVYYNLFAFIGADNRDNANYPTKGFKLDGIFKIVTSPNAIETNNTSFIDSRFSFNIPITTFLTIQSRAEFGSFFDNQVSQAQIFRTSGFNEQNFLNTNTFYGFPYGSIVGQHKWLIGAGLQFNFLKNHYVTPLFNWANYENQFDNLSFLEYDNRGYALKYGYDSPFGPLNVYWAYSPNTNNGLFNVSLGFWF